MMKRNISLLIALLSVILPLGAKGINPAIQDIIDSYAPWQTVTFSGKMSQEKLPASPTVKMFMIKDSLLQISLRVPLVGEVARVNMTKDELLIVNKMNKSYCKENPAGLFDLYPTLLSDLQSTFLARVVILGTGELCEGREEMVEIESGENGYWNIIPQSEPGLLPFEYGYVVAPNGRTSKLIASMPSKGALKIDYSFKNGGEKMLFTLEKKEKKTNFELDFDSVKWGGSPMGNPNLTNYTRKGLKEFFQSL